MSEKPAGELRLQLAEMELCHGCGASFQSYLILKALLEAGTELADIQRLLRVITTAGLSMDTLPGALEEIGGAVEMVKILRREIDSLEHQKADLVRQVGEMSAGLQELGTRAGEGEEILHAALLRAQAVREDAEHVAHTYRLAGFCFDDVIKPILSGNHVARTEHLDRDMLRALAGNLLTMCVELFGDQVFDLPAGGDNLVSVRVRLSRLPSLLAPEAAYEAQKRLIAKQKLAAERLAVAESQSAATPEDNAGVAAGGKEPENPPENLPVVPPGGESYN